MMIERFNITSLWKRNSPIEEDNGIDLISADNKKAKPYESGLH